MATDKLSQRPPRPLVEVKDCGLAKAAELLGDRWTLLVLREAFYGVTRFDAMLNDTSASKHALSSRLKLLVEADLLMRRSYQEPGTRERDEYVLTDKGHSLAPVLLMLLDWGQTHLQAKPTVELVTKSTGQPVKPAFLDSNGGAVRIDDITLKRRASR